MVWLRALVALPFGLALGSFMTVAIHRLPARESVARPRSRCPRCGVEIRSRDNIPVISWLLLRGRCRSCGRPISRVYPLTELTTAGLVIAAVLRFDRPWEGALVAGLLSLMPALAIIDIRHHILPNKLTHPALVIFPIAVVVAWIFDGGVDPVRALVGGLAYGGALFIVALVSGGMGMGDVKLAAVIGIVFGAIGLRYVAVAAGGAILFGGVAAIISLILGADRKSMIPFGPWIAAGAVVAGFWGDRLASAYISRVT
jgi:leader peptidase (prepilin peptidase)/N-methyltransferase